MIKNSITIDFLSKAMKYRRQQASLRREALARALGLKAKSKPSIVDATAGLAQDSFILACLGFKVTLLERSPIIYALLMDGMKRAEQDATVAPIIQRMHLLHVDAINWLKKTIPPDIVYLDPMFPLRKKTALPKKEMRLFHTIVGNDLDADLLLTTALTCAAQRVVVKRPRLAQTLADIAPTFSLKGSSSRFDIYILRKE